MENQAKAFNLGNEAFYLNGAYMSPLLKSVAEVGKRQVDFKLRPYTITGDDFFNTVEMVKQEFAKLINVKEPEQIAIIPSVSYGMANVVNNVNLEQKEIIIVSEQFPSNVYPWMELEKSQHAKLKIIAPPLGLVDRGKGWNERILEAITNETGMVAVSHIHWADGTKFDLKKIRERTREVGALLIIDGTQSVGAYPFDASEFEPDALICASYKWLLGPYGIGLAYYSSRFNNGKPIEQNWINRKESENFAGLVNYKESYQPGAFRYSVGEQSNFILIPMLLQALKQILEWGVSNVQAYCETITNEPIQSMRDKGYWVEDKEYRASHLFGVRKPNLDVDRVKKLLEENNIFVSIRGDSIRVSPNVYNTTEDLMKLVSVL